MAQSKRSRSGSSSKRSRSSFGTTNLDDLIDQILQKFPDDLAPREESEFSQNTYHDQHILQKGSDWRRQREAGKKDSVSGGIRGTASHSSKGSATSSRSATTSQRGNSSQGKPSLTDIATEAAMLENLGLFRDDLLTAAHTTATDGANAHVSCAAETPASSTSDTTTSSSADVAAHTVVDASAHEAGQATDESSHRPAHKGARHASKNGTYEPYGGYYGESYGRPYGGCDDFGNDGGFGGAGDFGAPDGSFIASSDGRYFIGPEDDYYGNAYDDPYGFDGGWPGHDAKVELTPVLQQMRDLENSLDENGKPLDEGLLFLQEAKLAADYEDDYQGRAVPNIRFVPTYAHLNNRELRAYFGWRTRWRHGQAGYECDAFTKICAFELLNGVGCKDQTDILEKLSSLRHDCESLYDWGTAAADIQRWMNDYILVFGMDQKLATTEAQRTYDHAAMVLRNAEKATLAKEGLLEASADAVPPMPTDEELWDATGILSTMEQGRSPFFREHRKEAAAVWSGVFRQMCIHCAKRRKTGFIDELLGVEYFITYRPFVGVPIVEGQPTERSFMRLTDARWFTKHRDTWREHIALDYRGKVTEIGNLLRALDWLMRETWGYSRKLKPRAVPKYLQKYIQKECDAVRQKEAEAAKQAEDARRAEEARRRRLTIDFSKLGHIRAAAATTREALLVDEEREDYVPEGDAQATQPGTAEAPKDAQKAAAEPAADAGSTAPRPDQPQPSQQPDAQPSQQPDAQPSRQPDARQLPMGLTDLEYQVACALLDGQRADDLVGPGTPTLEMLVDSINEKLFDQLGDTAFEFSEDGPAPIEDYIDDVRGILEQ